MPRQPFSPSYDRRIARHEAAHAVIAALVDRNGDTWPERIEVHAGSIGGWGGWTTAAYTNTERDVLVSMAGAVQQVLDGDSREQAVESASSDLVHVSDPALVVKYWSLVEDLLTRYRHRVDDTAALLERDGVANPQMIQMLLGGVRGLAYNDLPDSVHRRHGGPQAMQPPSNMMTDVGPTTVTPIGRNKVRIVAPDGRFVETSKHAHDVGFDSRGRLMPGRRNVTTNTVPMVITMFLFVALGWNALIAAKEGNWAVVRGAIIVSLVILIPVWAVWLSRVRYMPFPEDMDNRTDSEVLRDIERNTSRY